MPTWIERFVAWTKRAQPAPSSTPPSATGSTPTSLVAPAAVTKPVHVTLHVTAPSRSLPENPHVPADTSVDLSDLEALLRDVTSFAFAVWPSREGRPLTASAALRSLPPTRLLDYDLLVRRYTGIPAAQRDDAFHAFMRAAPEIRDAGLFVFAMSGHGHDRQRALEALHQHPSFLGFVAAAIRSADWVIPIRRIATPLAVEFIERADAPSMDAILPLLLRLLGHERVDHDGLANAMRAWASVDDRIERLLGHSDTRVRRWAYDIALVASDDVRPRVVALAIGDADPGIAKRGVAAMTSLSAEDRHALQRKALLASHPIIRRDTLRAMDAENRLSRADLVHALSDTAGGVRSLATYLAKERHGLAAIDVWREMFDGDALPSRSVVQALSERAETEDEARLRRALTHVNGNARASAIRALGRIGARFDDATVAAALADESGHVRKALRHVIRHEGMALDTSRFVHLTAHADDEARTWLLDSLGERERLDLLTTAWPVDDAHHTWLDDALRHLVARTLGWWPPSQADRDRFGDLLRRRAGDMAPDIRRHIEDALAR